MSYQDSLRKSFKLIEEGRQEIRDDNVHWKVLISINEPTGRDGLNQPLIVYGIVVGTEQLTERPDSSISSRNEALRNAA